MLFKKKKETKFDRAMKSFEAVASYLLSVALAFCFALFCSWRVGIFLFATFLLAPVISIIVSLLFSKQVQIRAELSKSFVTKKEHLTLIVSLRNKFFIPSPGVLLTVNNNPCVTYENTHYEVSLLPFQTLTIEIPVTADICGASKVGLESYQITDYLSLTKFAKQEAPSCTLAVVPDYAEISGDEEYIRQTYQLSTTSGDSDETVETIGNVIGGFPGYDHREYTPGDSLKRVNWKLSARKEKLYVRLDDEMAAAKVLMVLDPCIHLTDAALKRLPYTLYPETDESKYPALIAQNAVETALGISMTLLTRNLSVTFMYYDGSSWIRKSIINPAHITQLQQELASYSFNRIKSERFPIAPNEQQALFICTPSPYTEIPFSGVMVYSSLDGKGRQL